MCHFRNDIRKLIKNHFYYYVLILAFFFIHNISFSQSQHQRIKYYTLEDGLSQVSSNDLILDKNGFVWIATQDGLNRFDGNKFEHFNHDEQDSLTISGNLINKLHEDVTGKIWVGTIGNGLSFYNPKFDIFHRIKLENSLSDNEIISGIDQDQDHNIWISSRISGLHKLSPISDSAFQQESYLSNKTINGLLIDEENVLWAGESTGNIYKLNLSHNKISSKVPELHVEGNVQAFHKVENKLLIGSDFGFYIYDINKRKASLFELQKEDNRFTKHVIAFLKNDERSVWIGTGNGVYLFDWINNIVINKILYSNDSKEGLSNGTVQALLKISKDQMLVGTANYLNLVDLTEPYFKNISKNMKGSHLLNDNVIFSIFKEKDDLWVGTSDGGLNLIRNRKSYYFTENQNNSNGISGGVVRAIVKDSINQRMWFATTRGLNMIDLKTFNPNYPKFFVFHHNPENVNSINADFLKDIILDKNNNLWGATYGQGIFRLEYFNDKKYNIFRYRNKKGDNNSMKNDFVNCLRKDKENNIWIGTQGGLSKLSFEERMYENPIFSNFSKIQNDKNSLTHNSVYDILIDKNNRIWVGTRNGFSEYLGNNNFKSWTTQNQFSNAVVYSIQDDVNDNLWLGTNEGIVKFNPNDNSFKQYGVEDGIQSKEFDIHAKFKDKEGVIYLGGIGGVTYFNPTELDEIDIAQKLYFANLKVKSEDISVQNKSNTLLKQSLQSTDHLEFKHDQFPFFIQFSSIDFRINKSVEYRYKLLPNDTEWNNLKDPEIQFLNLPSGKYTLQVNGFSRGVEWNQLPLEMNITILSPWWSTWWAYTIYAAIAILFADRFYRFQLSKKLAINESNRLKEVSELKNSLYANITHEFRTPLTVILGMTNSLKSDLKNKSKSVQSLEMIERNGKNLLLLVNDLLDLAKVESGTMELKLIQVDVIPFVKYLSESFHSLAESKKINLTVYSEIDTLEMDIDVNKMASIVSNLLSNAIKFTSVNGKIVVHLNKIQSDDKQVFIIKVQDNGLGLAQEDVVHLFERFYQVDNESEKYQEGTGIGLSLVKEFVELMNGTIDVASTLGKGSTFIVQLPIKNNAIKTVDAKIAVELPVKKETNHIILKPIVSNETSMLPLVLIIEDNEDVAHYLNTCLKGKYRTIHAINGDIGIELAYENIPDIIVSDVMMPGKDGFEVCATLKTDERTDHIPIVLLTAMVTTEDRLTGLLHGADAYLAKPFNEKELFIRLDQLVLLRKKLSDKLQKEGLNSFLDKQIESPESKFLHKVKQFINEDISNSEFGSVNLASKLNLSESQVYRKLKAITDKSTAVFIRSVRLQRAKELIQTTDKTISEIAYEVGFNDPSWFSRAFKDEFGFAPSEINK
ncbi:helix-turn-helix domain-containing protein [Aureibaculum sp. A20]|uniref:histidine kinase n=1 Tax=Aureibaculum flavum TaxID=2795986 RepID=A0ABS0WWF9_9FLAO|nr:hybrid sensor histidine kinase/response regulator transcription factor [Aureibaculum flavum]MBJ2176323.1 helix-turn-helix domain-containing protein [Aureibaculum flavum]